MSDTFPDETLYPVLTSIADDDRIFASNSAAGHESSQIKGSAIKDLVTGALALKAPLASPALTGTPTAPTAAPETNTTQIATTAFVSGAIAACRPKHSYVSITTASTAIAAERGKTYGINANGCTLTLPVAGAAYVDGDEICVLVGVSDVRTLAIVSPSYISRGTGLHPLNTPFNLTGFGTFISFVKCSNVWMMSYPDYELAQKAPLASPALTGTPTAPTAAPGTNTTQIATTAFVTGAVAAKANDADVVKLTGNQSIGGTKTFTTSPVLPTPTAGDNTTKGATTEFVTGAVAGKAPLASPAFTGTPTAPTAAPGTNTTQLATTAFAAATAAQYQAKWTYSFSGVGGAISASAWTMHGFGASGTLILPLASSVESGVQVCAIVVAGGAEVVLTRSGSDQFATPTGLATTYTLRGTGSSIVLVRVSASAWVCVGAPDSLINAAIAPLAPLASPALTGTPTAPTAAPGTNTTQLATTAFCAAGFLPQFSAVVETGTNVTSPSVGTLYVSTLQPGDGSTPGSASLTCTLPSPTGNGGKVIGFSCKYGTYDSWNWQYDEANWSVQGHIDGVANNTNFTQHSCRPSGVIFWCNGTTWMRVSTWGAFNEHVY